MGLACANVVILSNIDQRRLLC